MGKITMRSELQMRLFQASWWVRRRLYHALRKHDRICVPMTGGWAGYQVLDTEEIEEIVD